MHLCKHSDTLSWTSLPNPKISIFLYCYLGRLSISSYLGTASLYFPLVVPLNCCRADFRTIFFWEKLLSFFSTSGNVSISFSKSLLSHLQRNRLLFICSLLAKQSKSLCSFKGIFINISFSNVITFESACNQFQHSRGAVVGISSQNPTLGKVKGLIYFGLTDVSRCSTQGSTTVEPCPWGLKLCPKDISPQSIVWARRVDTYLFKVLLMP